MTRIALRVRDPAEGGAVGDVEGLGDDGGAQGDRLVERGGQVGHLHIQRHAGAVALADVAGRAWLGSADAGRDLHDEAIADVPIEERAVEGARRAGSLASISQCDYGPCPVLHHRTSPLARRPEYRGPRSRAVVGDGPSAYAVRQVVGTGPGATRSRYWEKDQAPPWTRKPREIRMKKIA